MDTPVPKPTSRRVLYTLLTMLSAGATTGIVLRILFLGSPGAVPQRIENMIPFISALFIALAVVLVGFRRWVFPRRVVRFVLWIGVMLVSLVVLFYSEERWRGSRALAKLKREVEARGEKLNLASLAPPPVRDEENFAMTPLLAWLNDYEFSTNQFWKPVRFRDEKAEQRLNRFQQLPTPDFTHEIVFPLWPEGKATPLSAWRDFFAKCATNPFQNALQNPLHNAPVTAEPATDLLAMLARFEPELSELRATLGRPHTRFAWHYEHGFSALHGPERCADLLFRLSRVVRFRASAEIALGRGEASFQELRLLLRLADAQRGEPMMVAYARGRLTRLQFAMQPVWEGLSARVWNEEHLATLQEELSRTDLIAEWRNALHGEALVTIHLLEFFDSLKTLVPFWAKGDDASSPDRSERFVLATMLAFYPTGWNYQSRVTCYRYFELFAPPASHTSRARWFLEPVFQPKSRRPQRTTDPFFSKFIEPRLVGHGVDAAHSFPYTQMVLNQAMIACALERHRLAMGAFPETLEALVPRFLSVVPRDLDAKPLKYRRTSDGQFVLYSTGWNGKDEGGRHEPAKGGYAYAVSGEDDWVWRYPAK